MFVIEIINNEHILDEEDRYSKKLVYQGNNTLFGLTLHIDFIDSLCFSDYFFFDIQVAILCGDVPPDC